MRPPQNSRDHLNDRQDRFCREYLKDLNATAAARRAGYSIKAASTTGTKLVGLPKIQARIALLKQNRARRLEITTDSVVAELGRIAFSDIGDVASWGKRTVNLFDSATLEEDVRRAIAEVKAGKDGVKIKMHNKLQALDTLAKHLDFEELRAKIDGIRKKLYDGEEEKPRKPRRNYPVERKPARGRGKAAKE